MVIEWYFDLPRYFMLTLAWDKSKNHGRTTVLLCSLIFFRCVFTQPVCSVEWQTPWPVSPAYYTHDIQLNLPQALPDQLEQKLFDHTPCAICLICCPIHSVYLDISTYWLLICYIPAWASDMNKGHVNVVLWITQHTFCLLNLCVFFVLVFFMCLYIYIYFFYFISLSVLVHQVKSK